MQNGPSMEPYLKTMPLTPWHQQYGYEYNAMRPHIFAQSPRGVMIDNYQEE